MTARQPQDLTPVGQENRVSAWQSIRATITGLNAVMATMATQGVMGAFVALGVIFAYERSLGRPLTTVLGVIVWLQMIALAAAVLRIAWAERQAIESAMAIEKEVWPSADPAAITSRLNTGGGVVIRSFGTGGFAYKLWAGFMVTFPLVILLLYWFHVWPSTE